MLLGCCVDAYANAKLRWCTLSTVAVAGVGVNRAPGVVRRGLIDAGVELARHGGPNAVILREATRAVGVVPNAAYKHFADRDALLAAVCTEAMRQLAQRMDAAIAAVPHRRGTKSGAIGRLRAVNGAYLSFALEETGLFETAFAVPGDLQYADDAAAAGSTGRTPLRLLRDALDELVTASILPSADRPGIEYPVWATVHGMAVLLTRGPLRELPGVSKNDLLRSLDQFILRGTSHG